jgi:hypothetical protein
MMPEMAPLSAPFAALAGTIWASISPQDKAMTRQAEAICKDMGFINNSPVF